MLNSKTNKQKNKTRVSKLLSILVNFVLKVLAKTIRQNKCKTISIFRWHSFVYIWPMESATKNIITNKPDQWHYNVQYQ